MNWPAYVVTMRLVGWAVVVLVPVVAVVAEWFWAVMDPEACTAGLVCV